ncbi:MAG: DUF4249 family protein [Saprospiraceae bacterium]
MVWQHQFPVKAGDAYRVKVILADGEMILSDWETIQPPTQANPLNWAFDEIETISNDGLVSTTRGISFFSNVAPVTSNGEPAQLRWEFINAYQITDDFDLTCYIETPYKENYVYLLDGQTSPPLLPDYKLFSEALNVRHIEGYYLTVYQQSLTPQAFNYWQQVQLLLDREGSVFDNPAGAISTNLQATVDTNRIVYGYFEAFSQDTVRIFLSREDTGMLDYYCPRISPNGFVQESICNQGCITHPYASYSKPYYWP